MALSNGSSGGELRVAVVGSGPAGFYAAEHLLTDREHRVRVDMFERLTTPWGLVRSGVAPDHPKLKSVSRIYERTATQPGFRMFGNVELGSDLTHADLAEHYHAVVYAVGAQTDRRSGIPGEDLPGSWAATDFVGWYNGHPDYRDLVFDLSCERAIVVGNGNVAMDVARMLCLTREELAVTDVGDHALEVLAEHRIREIVVLGRRGPEQAAFTTPELRELGELSDADVVVDPAELEIDPDCREQAPGQTAQRNLEVLREFSTRAPRGRRRRIVLRFLASPAEIHGAERVEAVTIVRNRLVRADDGSLRARATDRTETLEAGLVMRAIGYTGVPLPGVPFDTGRGVIPNRCGRVLDGGGEIPGVYVTGWIKRGPSGVIGTNKKCAQETVDALLEDADAGRLPAPRNDDADLFEARLRERQPQVVTYAGWEAIDRHEKALGEPQGRPRVKLTRTEELLRAAEGATESAGA
ncbi:MAG: NADP oxidoreductase [Chloroflexi bacterium]|nr:MAG: NADP oxidoreductase [Chloroflexota bacterium]